VPKWDEGKVPEKMNNNDLVKWLHDRKGDLLEAFRKDMETLGFTW